MANFRTHLNGGILVSGAAVLSLHRLGVVPEGLTLVLFSLGVMGSLLPDIDADASAPVRAFFGVLGAVLAFAYTLPLAGRHPPLTLAAIWVGLFVSVRFLLGELFARFTVHRGIWHSWLAAGFAALAAVNLAHWLFDLDASAAWASGLMVGIGYMTHLVLDELSSMDLLNTRVRRSFGTALKPFSLKDPLSSLTMLAALAVLAWMAPAAPWAAPLLGAAGGPADHLRASWPRWFKSAAAVPGEMGPERHAQGQGARMLDIRPMPSQGVGRGIAPQPPPDLSRITYSAHWSGRGR